MIIITYDILGDKMKYSCLKQKPVVLLENGQVLGYIFDCCINDNNQCIQAYYVKRQEKFYKRLCPWLFPSKIYEINVHEICKIGDDLIFIQK